MAEIGFHPKNYGRTTNDVQGDSPITARFIGNLRKDITRLNVVSALTKNDLVDFFNFRVYEGGKIGVGVTGDLGVRTQIVERSSGRIIADSEAKQGEKADRWFEAITGKLELKAREYVLKVTRANNVNRSQNPNYAIQLTMGDKYREDYDTLEKPVQKQKTQITPASSGVVDLLVGGNNNELGLINLFA
ncbi:MAG: hypothetical protein GC131_06525 [Alphaproteobacteria bacterium]|nr:hypothetical protein [Alphaproteobacteria bacterium]